MASCKAIFASCLVFSLCFCLASSTRVFIVDQKNASTFHTIQSAIDAVPPDNNEWVKIHIKNGTYNEKVTIPSNKPFIHLRGENMRRTFIDWNDSSSMSTSATISLWADNFVASDITFVNSHNFPPRRRGHNIVPAVAAMIRGDKSAFYKCTFLGFQDTLLDDRGRHYFKHCHIEGAIDFIFGNGQSIYDKCHIAVNVGAVHRHAGYITAQGREYPDNSTGYVFKDCDVTIQGSAFLGRAYRNSSRVIYYNTYLPKNVVPRGWDSWGKDVNKITYAEHECRGSGSNTSKRVQWRMRLRPEELQAFTNISYVDNEGWIGKLPIDVTADDNNFIA